MSFLKKLGSIATAVGQIAPIVGPLVQAVAPSAGQIVTRATGEIDEIARIVAELEVVGQALSLPGAQKLAGATPLIGQLVLQTSALAGKEIADPALFTKGCEQLGAGMADILNSLKAPA